MSATLIRDAAHRPVIAIHGAPESHPAPPPAPVTPPTCVTPDDRTAATWSLSWALIRGRAARDAVAVALAQLDGGDVQTLALLEAADERLAAQARAQARQYRRAAAAAS